MSIAIHTTESLRNIPWVTVALGGRGNHVKSKENNT